MNVRLTDGTTTVTLTSGTYSGVTYFPAAASVSEARMPGFELADEMRIVASGSASELIAARNSIESLLNTARRRQQTRTGARVFVEYQNATGADWYRSEILDGRLAADEEPVLRRVDSGTNVFYLAMTRRPYWEGPRTQLVDAEVIANGESGNSVAIAAVDVDGTLPAPLEIRIENAEAGTVSWRNFYMACNAWNDPATFSPFLTGDSLSWSANSTHATTRWTRTLSDAQLSDMAGDYFRLILGWSTPPNDDGYWKMLARFSNNANMVEGGEVFVESGVTPAIVDMGAMPFPPGGFGSATLVVLELSLRATAAGAGTLDFVALWPANNFRRLHQLSYAAVSGAAVVDDGIEGVAYTSVSTARYPIVLAYGDPLMVWPGRANTLYVLYDQGTTFTPGNEMEISVWYRPRRVAI